MSNFFRDLLQQADTDVSKVMGALGQFRKRVLAKCATCGDSGMIRTSTGAEVRCTCEAGHTISEHRRLPPPR